ncbi:MAG: response regulator [Myxococcota bacterium]
MATLLLVEDNPDLREVYSRLLEDVGHRVHTAPDGAQGIAAIRDVDPDVVLMDVEMPVLDGISAIRQLKSDVLHQDIRDVPVIFLTSHAEPEVIQQGLDAGADAYIVKPVVAADLVDELHLILTSGELGLD